MLRPFFAAKTLRHILHVEPLSSNWRGGGLPPPPATKQQTPVTPLSPTGLCETERGRRDQDSKVSTKTLVCPPSRLKVYLFLTSTRANYTNSSITGYSANLNHKVFNHKFLLFYNRTDVRIFQRSHGMVSLQVKANTNCNGSSHQIT